MSRSPTLFMSVILPLGLFVFGYSGGLEYVGKKFTLFIKFYGETELQKLESGGFYNAAGAAEYIVSIEYKGLSLNGAEYLLAQEGVEAVRPTDFSGWYVVELGDAVASTVKRLRALPETGFAFPNRGAWFCH